MLYLSGATMDDMEAMLERAAQRGATEALKRLGLDDDTAPKDMAELRSLLSAWRDMRREFFLTLTRWLTVFVLGILVLLFGSKFGFSVLAGWMLPKP
jgi:hypothetical protein